ncbi:MAG: hemerythrin domain-containing protein [Phycisphaerae bacterium]|nr:hemerythrin domain-containing protein [Phycisphaerae bacterium]
MTKAKITSPDLGLRPKPETAHDGLGDLADHIVATHHAYLRQQIPRLKELIERARADGRDEGTQLRAIHELFDPFMAEVELHMQREEELAFPMIRQLEKALEDGGVYGGGLDVSIMDLRHDHAEATRVLGVFRALTDDYAIPGTASDVYAELMTELEALEIDMIEHTRLENEVLFPRAIAAQTRLIESPGARTPHGPPPPDGPA